jgi:hypothetical protein
MSLPLSTSREKARLLASTLSRQGVACGIGRVAQSEVRPVRGFADLPGLQGADRGRLTEWLSEDEGAGAATIALAALQAVTRPDDPLLLVSGERPLSPWMLAAAGVEDGRAVLVRPGSVEESSWAIEQAMRCEGVGGVVAWIDRAPERLLTRLQLAVEQGGGWGFLIRPVTARREKCWGAARFLVHPQPVGMRELTGGWRRVGIEVLAGRGGSAVAGQSFVAEVCDATGHVRLVPPLADSTSGSQPAGVETIPHRPR